MRTTTALALSIAGILLTGSAALAANTQTLNNSSAGTTGKANTVLLPDGSATRTPTAPVRGFTAAAGTPEPTATATGTPGEDRKASPPPASSAPAAVSVVPGDDKGGQRTVPESEPGDDKAGPGTAQTSAGNGAPTAEPGDDKGGQRTRPEPGDDNGGLRAVQMPPAAAAGDDKGGLRTAPESGDDKGGLRNAPEPGDDGGHGGHGSDD